MKLFSIYGSGENTTNQTMPLRFHQTKGTGVVATLALGVMLHVWNASAVEVSRLTFTLHGGQKTDGIVRVERKGTFHYVCVDPWLDGRAAEAICKAVGLSSSNALVMDPNRYMDITGIKSALKLELKCTQSGADCEVRDTNQFCHDGPKGPVSKKLAAVYCYDEALQYRLTKPHSEKVDRLEVLINNTWGPVCRTASSEVFGRQACKAMGLPSTDARTYRGVYYGGGFPSDALVLNECLSPEGTPPGYCQYNRVGHPCINNMYLGLSCAEANEGQIRLKIEFSGFQSGEVEVYHRGAWHSLAVNQSKSSAIHVATVICRTLNFSTNGVEGNLRRSWSTLWLDDVDCKGDETNLFECSGSSLENVQNTTFGKALEVTCGTGDDAIQLRNDGLLMMRRGGQWGTICDQNFHNLDAAVICKALNKPNSFAWASTGTNDPKRTETIWTDRFWCKTINDNWQDCRQKNYMMAGCTHETDVFITCAALDKSSVQYRLSEGPVPLSGVVEMRVNNTWGGICRSGFTNKEARVVCRSLNLSTAGAEVVNPKIFPTPGDGHIWLGGVKCQGTETSILDCEHNYIGRPRCARLDNAAVAVKCGEAPVNRIDDFTLRLVGEADSKPSRVEIMLMGEWGTICDQQFDKSTAKTVCRQLGLPSTLASVADKGTFEPGTGKIWLTNTSCYGFESSVKDCKYVLAWSTCDHSQDVGVVCKNFTTRYNSDSGVPVELIIGVSLGSIAILFGAIVVFVVIKLRLFKPASPVAVPSSVQYSAPPKQSSQAYRGSTHPGKQDPLIQA